MKRKPLEEVVQKVLDNRKKILREEVAFYENLAMSNVSYWGYGGPVARQEAAAEKRRKEIEIVEQFEKALRHFEPLENIKVYSWYCRECGSLTMTTRYPSGEWHECGSCRKMIHKATLQEFEIQTPSKRYFACLIRRLKGGDHDV